jgi:A/G-specific adenine glycosylase
MRHVNHSPSKVGAPGSRGAVRRRTPAASAPILADAAPIARRLLAWYRRHRRDLPWRRTRDPYAIWLSETMLQQTRVATVIPYYHAFLGEFPDIRRLAEAPLERVLGRWSGLGYYTRARHLHAAARAVVARHGGRVPDDETALGALPGIGRYTRGAILSIAFDRPAPVLDGNVARVLVRCFAIPGDARRPAVARRLWELAAGLVPPRAPGEFNQALMELGALVCLPRGPRCSGCPLRARCRAFLTGRVERYPTPRARRPAAVRHAAAAILESARGIWLESVGPGVNHGLFDLPAVDGLAETAWTRLRARLRRAGATLSSARRLGTIRHGVLDIRYVVEVRHVRATKSPRARGGRWMRRSALAGAPLTARARKALSLLAEESA